MVHLFHVDGSFFKSVAESRKGPFLVTFSPFSVTYLAVVRARMQQLPVNWGLFPLGTDLGSSVSL